MNALAPLTPDVPISPLLPVTLPSSLPDLPTSPLDATHSRPGGSWSDERVEFVKKLWADGLSASQIAVELGGVTRNAVIGKIHRLGLCGRADDMRRPHINHGVPRTPKTRRKKIVTVQADGSVLERLAPYVPETLPPPDAKHLCTMDGLGPLHADDMQCRAPVGEPGTDEFRFCGTPGAQLPGPYCSFHHRLFYQPGSALGGRTPKRQRASAVHGRNADD